MRRPGDQVELVGQHSLTSVERPSYLRSGFVNVWRHARLVVPLVTSLRSSTLICLMIWCLFRGLVLLFRSSLDWFNQEDATASVWKGCFNVSPRSSLLAHQEGPFSGCYRVTSLEWPRIEWHSWRNYTNKQIKLKWTAAPFNNFLNIGGNFQKRKSSMCVMSVSVE